MKANGKEEGRVAKKKAVKTEAKSEASAKKIRFCMYHLQGVCKYTDETCAFAHSTEEITASRRGKRVGQVGPAAPPPAGPVAHRGRGVPPPPEAPLRRQAAAEMGAKPLGQRRGGGAQQPAASDPMKVGARGRGQDLAWLPGNEGQASYNQQVPYPDARDRIAAEMFQREYAQQLRGFPPPPPGIPSPDPDIIADQSIGDLQRSIVNLSQAIKRLTVQPSALQDPAVAAPLGAEMYGQQLADRLSEAHEASMGALQGLPRGGRGGVPPARLDDAGAVDRFAPRKIAVSPQSLASCGLGGGGLPAGGGVMAQDAPYGQPLPADWAPAAWRRDARLELACQV